MEASLKLLNQYVKVDDQNPEELCEKITRIGLEVEGHHTLVTGNKLTIGKVLECVDHPDSDHLKLCQVDLGDKVTQIVCGAPNVKADIKVIVALPGCQLYAGKISAGKIRGQESNGMICSIAELIEDTRLLRDEDKDGIHILDDDAPVGGDPITYLGLDDFIMEIGLTPNRSDCMAIQSLAYEVGAVLHRPVTRPEITKYDELDSDIKVEVETDLCPFFGAKLIKGVETHESPEWLRTYLIASGIKPINNVVDISNFVMLETGQPIHMYDYDKLKEKTFTIKTGFDTKALLLDELEYDILPEDIIVSTDNGIGCVAGVMGGNDTKIDENTVNIVVEAATFDGPSLRNTARRMNLLTDASQHYIKGAIDTANTLNVLDRCADLLKQLCHAKEIYKTVSTPLDIKEKKVTVSVENVNHLLGTDLGTDVISDIFTSLCFDYKEDNGVYDVIIPTYRNDITMAADLIEEVARLYGYDNLPSTLPEMSMTHGLLTHKQLKEQVIRHILSHIGLHETLTYTLTSPKLVNDFNIFHEKEDTIALMWPLGEERSVTRKSLIPHMLNVVKYNNDHSTKDVNIFEISNTYSSQELSELAIVMSGTYVNVPWMKQTIKPDFYMMKGIVENLFSELNIDEKRYTFEKVERDNKDYHPGRSAYIKMGKKIVGVVGQLHPLKEKKYDVKETYLVQLNLSELLSLRTKALQVKEIPLYPAVDRDIAIVVDETLPASRLEMIISRASKLVKDTTIFDVYAGEHVEEGKKSVAISLHFEDPTRTLDDKTISTTMETILERLQKEAKAILRQ